ncbi:MAG: hypothetical protein E6809_09610 [Anaerococcus vaginalis]|uniref:hypothetical protein n=1 Tax=Anaerococcus vaginalis TaxID=33037 RepID=UPI0029022E10|nr:hypothetical protein [Anaerococcus vaginalis]MDU1764353.1 hypothetical protein [Anaerococcus vaginalis]
MKKYLKILLLIFVAGIIFTACTGKDQGLPNKKISEINWTLDRMINTDDGKDLSNDVAIKFDKKNFVMTDRSNAIDFTGTYELKKAGTGYQVIMKFDDFEETSIAGYGMKTEKNKDPVPNLVFDFMGRNYSFIGEEKK